jgi:hypothetical protein
VLTVGARISRLRQPGLRASPGSESRTGIADTSVTTPRLRQPGLRASPRFGISDRHRELKRHHAPSSSAGSSRKPPVQNPEQASRTQASPRPLFVSRVFAPDPGSESRTGIANSSVTTPFAEPQGRATQRKPRSPSSSAGSSRQPPAQNLGQASRTQASPRPSQSLRDVPPGVARLTFGSLQRQHSRRRRLLLPQPKRST